MGRPRIELFQWHIPWFSTPNFLKNDMGKYDGQACPAIVFSHMAYCLLRYKKPNDHLIITDLLMESNLHLINTNHIVLYSHYCIGCPH